MEGTRRERGATERYGLNGKGRREGKGKEHQGEIWSRRERQMGEEIRERGTTRNTEGEIVTGVNKNNAERMLEVSGGK